jgi:hypothetical protein
VFCRGDDGHHYFVKGNYAGNKALVAEWVANRLGRLLGLPIPEFAMLQVDPLLIKYGAKPVELARLGSGTVFGSRYVPNLVEIRETDLPQVDFTLQANVLAFDWWIANSDRIFVDGAGNPNLLWSETDQRLWVIDHNLAFDPTLMADFWGQHAFRAAEAAWTEDFIQAVSHEFRQVLTQLPGIWRELPEEWLSTEIGLTLAQLEVLLWRFDREPAIFWSRL